VDIPLPSYTFATDACESGGGAYFLSDWFYMSWVNDCPELIDCHITVLELYTVYLALSRWGEFLCNAHVCIRSDCMSAVAALNKSTSRSKNLMPIVREIFWLSVKFNITISSSHIAGKLNVLSDRISRLDNICAASDARLLLANFSWATVTCKDHMSIATFLWLQVAWRESLKIYA
jgi:hypothetical protein